MATKTISIDLEAYKRLRAAKVNGESFSEVIKRVIRPRMSAEEFLRVVRANRLSEEAERGVREQIANRRRPTNRSRARGLR